MNFGEKLREKRHARGLTQMQLAEKANVSQSVIAQFERGSKQPTIPTAKAIADALDCELSELVD